MFTIEDYKMHKVQVLATRPWNVWFPIVSWLIRLSQLSKESEVAWYFPDRQIIRIASLDGIKEMNIDHFMEKNRLVNMKTISLTEKQYTELEEYTKSKLSENSKNLFSTLGFIFVQFFKKILGIKIKNPFNKQLTSAEYIREGARKVDELTVFILTHNVPKGNFNTEDAIDLASELSKETLIKDCF